MASVNGCRRVPDPPARIIPFMILKCQMLMKVQEYVFLLLLQRGEHLGCIGTIEFVIILWVVNFGDGSLFLIDS